MAVFGIKPIANLIVMGEANVRPVTTVDASNVKAPNTLAEFAINQYNNLDFIDMSMFDGFNVPMEISSDSGDCNQVIKCTVNIIGQCPTESEVLGRCNEPCPVFKIQHPHFSGP
ncbi:hypothetical protein Patl1_18735 [Pistacia atlantica]|uniref:Uncharacterized protein n=1 Tax=Pistacia atlantica TaxID=434234 RepID=A0ACC1BZJ0_9ROSI|nr:hypothetical protein Patl1_18735 [Pistacia atlantica]